MTAVVASAALVWAAALVVMVTAVLLVHLLDGPEWTAVLALGGMQTVCVLGLLGLAALLVTTVVQGVLA